MEDFEYAYRMDRRPNPQPHLHRYDPANWLIDPYAQVLTGGLLFASEAVKLSTNPAFRIKLLLIGLAGTNALIFHVMDRRALASWDERGALPIRARLAGAASLLLWAGVVAAGRLIGFV